MTWKDKLLQENAFPAILGQTRTKRQVASALLAKRHILVVGPPGIGKTTLAKSIATLLPEIEITDEFTKKSKKVKGLDRFVRVQGSPDLTVEDLFGDIDPIKALKFGPRSLEAFSPGKIFKANQGILFFDELNRAPEKTQNALLQVLEEGTVTIGSYAIDIPTDFIFIGTMNPEEGAATEKLSSVLMDRFDVIHMGYPESEDIEHTIVKQKAQELGAVLGDELLLTVLLFIQTLRRNKNLVRKPSVRASIGLYERAQANALLDNRKEVTIKDVAEAMISVLAHRIELKPSLKFIQSPEQFLQQEFKAFCQENPDVATHEGDGL